MTDDTATTPRSTNRNRGARWALAAGIVVAVVGGSFALSPSVAAADVPHNSCDSVIPGGSAGWCGLYPGNATTNIAELGDVSVSPDGMTLTVNTQSATDGTVPASSFACLVFTAASAITHRLQDTLCGKAGGVYFPASGGTITIDLTQYPQFLNANFTVQVAANDSANDSNGDAFYNNVSVTTMAATPT